jgi:hypothetical protein
MNETIAKHTLLFRAHTERQDAIASLERVKVKRKGDTQAINRAQRRVEQATHRLMQAEREVFA